MEIWKINTINAFIAMLLIILFFLLFTYRTIKSYEEAININKPFIKMKKKEKEENEETSLNDIKKLFSKKMNMVTYSILSMAVVLLISLGAFIRTYEIKTKLNDDNWIYQRKHNVAVDRCIKEHQGVDVEDKFPTEDGINIVRGGKISRLNFMEKIKFGFAKHEKTLLYSCKP